MPPVLPNDNDKDSKPIIETSYRLAINVNDLLRQDETIRTRLLAGRLDKERIDLRTDKSKPGDDIALALVGDILEAAIVCDYLRNLDREVGDSTTRVYIKKGDKWQRLASNAVLTIPTTTISNGKGLELNPVMFDDLVRTKVFHNKPQVQRLEIDDGDDITE